MIIKASKVKRIFSEGTSGHLEVLGGIDLSVESGEILAITGESGVGKSTLLHLLGLLDKPSAGEIYLFGKATGGLSENKRAEIRNLNLGFVFQFHHLLPEFNALENVAIPARLSGLSEQKATQKAIKMLESVGLQDRMSHFPNALSGGEQQRVALARALICEPALLLADEPTGNLDEKNENRLMDILFKQAKTKNLTVVLATHNRELAARADRVFLLEKGLLKDIEGGEK